MTKPSPAPGFNAKTPFQRFDALVHVVLRSPRQPKPAPRSPRRPSC